MQTKVCKKCNVEKPITEYYYVNKLRGYVQSYCKKCTNQHKLNKFMDKPTKDNNPLRKKAKAILSSCKQRNNNVTIDEDWIFNKLSYGKCEVTGLKLTLAVSDRGGRNPYTPSLDKKDPKAGYTPENTQLVCWMYNAAKNDWTHEDVMNMVNALKDK